MEALSALFPDFAGERLCSIKYGEDYRFASSILQWVISTDDHSERVLTLTHILISECEGHYTAWSYRRSCIGVNDKNALEREMQWIDDYTTECPKNYQLWQHRMLIYKGLQTNSPANRVEKELASVKEELDRNPKNYHAWQYRQWLCSSFDLDRQKEYKVTVDMLRSDSFNNSVYNHLVFLYDNYGREFILPDDLKCHFLEKEGGRNNHALQAYLSYINKE
jgi:protein farnesyltransferase/geranylgeranyltransferase type-1 subunit alpha